VRSLLGTRERSSGSDDSTTPSEIDIESLRSLLDPLRASLREDGATLTLDEMRGDVLHARLEVDEAACADGTCVLPRRNLVALLEATLRERFTRVHVVLDDSRERVS